MNALNENKGVLKGLTNNVHFLPIILVQDPRNLTQTQLDNVRQQITTFVDAIGKKSRQVNPAADDKPISDAKNLAPMIVQSADNTGQAQQLTQ